MPSALACLITARPLRLRGMSVLLLTSSARCALQAFERLLFRATRGNMYLRHATVGTVVDPITGEKQEKAVFVVFFAGERARTKILKVR